eukprot:tig00001371_g8430.t1
MPITRNASECFLHRRLGLDQIDVTGRRVLLRVDFNVPLRFDGSVADGSIIREALPTIRHLLQRQPKVLIIASHLGRPGGRVVPSLSLETVAEYLQGLLGRPVRLLDDCVGEEVRQAIAEAPEGAVLMLENLRFHPEEEGRSVDPETGAVTPCSEEAIAAFARQLSSLANIYVNDAFATAHRPSASLVRIESPIRAAGLLMKRELESASMILENARRPFLCILGGGKVAEKIGVLSAVLERCQELIVGGAMAFTFMKKLHGMEIGGSLYDETGAKLVSSIMKKASRGEVQVHLPIDFCVGNKALLPSEKPAAADVASVRGGSIFKSNGSANGNGNGNGHAAESSLHGASHFHDDSLHYVSAEEGIPDDCAGLDIGPKSAAKFSSIIGRAKTILWVGPMGVAEIERFGRGTKAMLYATVAATGAGATSVIAGSDMAAACERYEAGPYLTHISTGGGAMLELLEGKELQAVTALSWTASASD